ncbi:CC-NBS-LRR resistance protein [Trifolium medium]|uniref:CC-NBS-LRR resistance protein n=1 Tax=Trifolium medium TaxID=97028 RepID=A0A392LYV8_9FABA|nr:CC-NBS-LRR resistance protein [Trifolium medium]
MVSVLTDLTKQCVEKLINGAITEARHVFCFTCITKEFEEERARLEAERITLGQRAKVAIGRDKDIQANVCLWEEEADKLIQEDTKTKQTCLFGFCPNCIWRYKRGKELANNLEEVKRLFEKGEKLENIELPRRLPDVERYSSQNYISFKSRELKYKELFDALKDDNSYIIGLQGMGGTGKTTMAKEVGKDLKQSKQFDYVIDTTISSTPNITKIQDDIAGPLGLKWEDCNESDRPKRLWSRLTNGDKILLIMDDVWDRDPALDFDAIGIPKQDNHKGCRVLVTSRSKQIFNKMDCDKIIEVDLLSEEDAWIMFKRYANICNSSSKKLISKGRKIVKECKQLPVAIAVIASSLKGQQHREHEWDVTLKSLKKPASMHGIDDDMVGIYKCLKLSYDYMKDEKAKGLFLLCSVFREDQEISIEVLTRLCIGAGVFGEGYGNYDDARNQVIVAKNKLLDSCLLLEVSEERVKMHDFVRDVAQWIANKEIRGVNLSDKNQKSLIEKETNIRYLLCEGKNKDLFSWKFDGSKLETLIVHVDRDEGRRLMEVPNSFLENVMKLRVWYFSGNDKRPLSLPRSIHSLTNIRSMLVDSMDLGDISILGSLQSLETLDLVECTINELPNEFTKLEKFKLLNLEKCEIRRSNPFEVIERCSSLEELYFRNSFNGFCREVTLPKLQRYHIQKALDKMNGSIPKYLVFDADVDDACIFSKGALKYCMQTAEVLRLDGIKGEWKNLMPEMVPIDLSMNSLVELSLSCISELQYLIDTIGSQLPNVLSKLVVLKLERMDNLEELFNAKPQQSKDHHTAELPGVSFPVSIVDFSKPGATRDIANS